MTFTAARVKQEIAKEGILPWSLHIAQSYETPWAKLKRHFARTPKGNFAEQDGETAPTVAFALHWLTSVLLLIAVSPVEDTRQSYSILVSLYSYTMVLLLGCWVSIGLLKIKLRKNKWHWQERRRYRPWLSPVHAIIYGAATAFMLVTTFVEPSRGSPYHQSASGVLWYIVPTIGITAPFWGVFWYWGLLIHEWRTGRQLMVSRQAYWMQDPDCPSEYVQRAEIIRHAWPPAFHDEKHTGAAPVDMLEDADDAFEMPVQGECAKSTHPAVTSFLRCRL